MELEVQLRACKEDPRFVLLSKEINGLILAEHDVRARDLKRVFTSVTWKGDTESGFALCTFDHTRLNSVAFEFDEHRIVDHEFA